MAVGDAATAALCGATGQPYHVRVFTLPQGTQLNRSQERNLDDCHVMTIGPAEPMRAGAMKRDRSDASCTSDTVNNSGVNSNESRNKSIHIHTKMEREAGHG
eukprot:7036911-Prymnesium_polylepis.2